MQLCPGLYEQERARVAARFEEAVRLAEQAFLDEFARLVGAPDASGSAGAGEDGQPKVFRDSAVGNLTEFFERFRELNVRSNDAARRAGRPRPSGRSGASAPRTCATATALRQRVAGQLSRVQSALDGMLVDRPRRRILRQAAGAGGGVMHLVVDPGGTVRGDLRARRSTWPPSAAARSPGPAMSSPTRDGRWHADLRPVGGPVLGPFDRRSEALAAEVAWLEEHWLGPARPPTASSLDRPRPSP